MLFVYSYILLCMQVHGSRDPHPSEHRLNGPHHARDQGGPAILFILIQYIHFYADSIIRVLILFICNSYSHICQVSSRDKLDGLNTHEVNPVYTTLICSYLLLISSYSLCMYASSWWLICATAALPQSAS